MITSDTPFSIICLSLLACFNKWPHGDSALVAKCFTSLWTFWFFSLLTCSSYFATRRVFWFHWWERNVGHSSAQSWCIFTCEFVLAAGCGVTFLIFFLLLAFLIYVYFLCSLSVVFCLLDLSVRNITLSVFVLNKLSFSLCFPRVFINLPIQFISSYQFVLFIFTQIGTSWVNSGDKGNEWSEKLSGLYSLFQIVMNKCCRIFPLNERTKLLA